MSVPDNMPIRSEQGEARSRNHADSLAGAEADIALARGILYAAAALGLETPNAETLHRLTATDAVAALSEAAALVEQGGDAPDLTTLAQVLERDDALADVEAAHLALFGHTARGPVAAYETEYGHEALFEQPQQLADLSGILAAFGLESRHDSRQRLDHVSAECELMAFLSQKEAWALDNDDQAMLAATRRASEVVLREHLGRFVPALAARIGRAAPGSFHDRVATLLLALVRSDSTRLGVPLGADTLALRPDPEAVAAPMGCTSAGDGPCSGSGCGP